MGVTPPGRGIIFINEAYMTTFVTRIVTSVRSHFMDLMPEEIMKDI